MFIKNRFYILLALLISIPMTSWAYTSNDYFQGALTYYQQKNYNAAIRYLQIAVQNDPSNWQAYQVLGNCYHAINDDYEALQAYDKSLKANPNNPGLKSYADVLRAASPTPTPPPESKARAITKEYYNGIDLQQHARTQLSEYGKDHTLTREEHNIVAYDSATCARDDRRFQLGLNFFGPSLVGLDAGLSLDPTTNLGVTGVFIPLGASYYWALEPRIKFYSSPKDLSFFFGLGLLIADSNDGSSNVNSGWIAPNCKIGLSLVDSNGLYFELDWSIGILLYSTTTTTTSYDYTNQTTTNTTSTTSAFAAGMIPAARIGLML